MPGTKKENISLEVDGNVIRIGVMLDEGVTEESESPDKKWHRSERREYHSFQQRALRMPAVSYTHLTLPTKRIV